MKRKHVIAAVEIKYSSSRDLVSGIFSRMDRGLDWEFAFSLSEDDLRDRIATAKRGKGADGFVISAFLGKETVEELATLDVPIVTIGVHNPLLHNRNAPTIEIHNDGRAIGRLAAKYLDRLGRFASRAFVHVNSERELGYSDERLSGVGQAEVFESPFPEGSENDIAALGEFLVKLPKPAAVIAAHDKRALDVISAAHKSGLKIPQEISVIGIDNDEVFCSHSNPPLTSVQPGHFEMGVKAADELNRIFKSKVPVEPLRIIKIPPKRIVERDSTSIATQAEQLVQRATDFINANACKDIVVDDVASYLRCSRPLLDLRFRERLGITVRQAIENRRLKEVQRLLRTSKRSLSAIAEQCGFSSECRLSHLFTQRFGVSPSEWRKARR